jgi:hypothetical protein
MPGHQRSIRIRFPIDQTRRGINDLAREMRRLDTFIVPAKPMSSYVPSRRIDRGLAGMTSKKISRQDRWLA